MKKKTETNNSKSNLNRLAEVLQESITNKDHLRNSPVLSNKDKACTTRVYCKQAPSHRQIFNVSFGKATQEDVAWIMEILRKEGA